MKTLKEIRLEYIRSILDENGWDFRKASRILEIPESRLLREAKSLGNVPHGTGGKEDGNEVKESFTWGKRPSHRGR